MAASKKAAAKKTSIAKVKKEEYFVLDHTRESVLCGPADNETAALNAALESEFVGADNDGMSVTIVKTVARYATKSELVRS